MQSKSPYDKRGRRHGYWEWYYSSSPNSLMFKGNYIHGKAHGYWERYYLRGTIKCKTYYAN